MDGVMAALGTADRIRAAEIAWLRLEAVVTAFAVGGADRMNGREIKYVEAHVADRRHLSDHIVEAAVTIGTVGGGAGKKVVPAGEAGPGALDVEGKARLALRAERTLAGGRHRRAR